MIKLYTFALLSFSVFGCKQAVKDSAETDIKQFDITHALFSPAVQDSFYISVHLPDDYYSKDTTYPIVFILDANLYFDIYKTIEDRYSEVGLLPKMILVGVGYKDFYMMDSLRNRDYTYPVAIAEYEMTTSGGAGKFNSFFSDQLIKYIDSSYRTDTGNRILMGHSLGGYFALYSLSQQLTYHKNIFAGFIAASPSTHYNRYYILNTLEKTGTKNKNIKAYISSGGLEDNSSDTSMLSIANVFASLQSSLQQKSSIQLKTDVYSNLDHLDTQIPSFIKGLQWMLFSE